MNTRNAELLGQSGVGFALVSHPGCEWAHGGQCTLSVQIAQGPRCATETRPQVRSPYNGRMLRKQRWGKNYIREWRLPTGLTLWDIAEQIGSTHATLSRIETGKLPYNQGVLEAVALIFRCHPAELLMPPPPDWAERAKRLFAKAALKT